MLNMIVYLTVGIVSCVQRGESVRKTTADKAFTTFVIGVVEAVSKWSVRETQGRPGKSVVWVNMVSLPFPHGPGRLSKAARREVGRKGWLLLTSDTVCNISSTCVVLALVAGREHCQPRPNSQ